MITKMAGKMKPKQTHRSIRIIFTHSSPPPSPLRRAHALTPFAHLVWGKIWDWFYWGVAYPRLVLHMDVLDSFHLVWAPGADGSSGAFALVCVPFQFNVLLLLSFLLLLLRRTGEKRAIFCAWRGTVLLWISVLEISLRLVVSSSGSHFSALFYAPHILFNTQ